jgi:hypothetical protein
MERGLDGTRYYSWVFSAAPIYSRLALSGLVSAASLAPDTPLRFGRRLFHSFTPLPLSVIFKKIPDPVRSLHHSCGSTLVFLFYSCSALALLRFSLLRSLQYSCRLVRGRAPVSSPLLPLFTPLLTLRGFSLARLRCFFSCYFL